MNTPICDFVQKYIEEGALRLHMPGHKGVALLGPEAYDLTEIDGADSLYEATGIIRQSEENASSLFGCSTLYSTEGSSQCIRAMLYLAFLYGRAKGRRPFVAAGRNAHKTFLSGVALLDIQVHWLYSAAQSSYLTCQLTAEELEAYLANTNDLPIAVYVTSPDYLGNVLPVCELAQVCHKYDVLLLVDNAHGAYLHFLPESRHPMDLGADICCDSAHKTLPVLTGGAYLHVSDTLPQTIRESAKNAMAMFGSTSPSYLILQSLDKANAYLAEYPKKLQAFCNEAAQAKQALSEHGYKLCGDEPIKVTIQAKAYGYTGIELAQKLQEQNIFCEFADADFLVLMLTPETGKAGLEKMVSALCAIPKKQAICTPSPAFFIPQAEMTVREAALSLGEYIPVEQSEGRILQAASVGCPPAVPIVVCGERITKEAIHCFLYYGITHCNVVCGTQEM